MVVAIVDTGHHLAQLGGEVGIGMRVGMSINAGTDGTREPTHATCVHDNVEDGGHPFGIVLGSRLGDNLNAPDHAGGDGLEHILGVAVECGVRVAVLVNLERRGAFHFNLVLRVNAHQRHLAQHVHQCDRAAVGVSLHVVAQAVHLVLDQEPLGGHFHLAQSHAHAVNHGIERAVVPLVIGCSGLRRHGQAQCHGSKHE